MEEAISHGISSMITLMGFLVVVFGALIVFALVLRYRLNRQSKASSVSQVSVLNAKKGDLLSVLGRTFTVDDVKPVGGADRAFTWVCLSSDDDTARAAFANTGDLAISFPGKAYRVDEDGLPSSMSLDGKEYKRADNGPDGQGGAGEQGIALYSGESGFWLALEKQSESVMAWRGKEIPSEGVSLLQD